MMANIKALMGTGAQYWGMMVIIGDYYTSLMGDGSGCPSIEMK